MDWLTEDHRFGLYWLGSAVLFARLAIMGAWRFHEQPKRPRAAIIAFAVSWAALAGQNASVRLSEVPTLTQGLASEAARLAGMLSLLWLSIEFARIGRRNDDD